MREYVEGSRINVRNYEDSGTRTSQSSTIKPRSPSSQASTLAKGYRTAFAVAVRNLYMAIPVNVAITHGLMPGAQVCKWAYKGKKLLTAFTRIELASDAAP
jgi:hypothetical protein